MKTWSTQRGYRYGTLRLQHHQCLQPRTCAASNFCRYNSTTLHPPSSMDTMSISTSQWKPDPQSGGWDVTTTTSSMSAATNMYSVKFLPLQPSKSSILRRRWTPYIYICITPANENLIDGAGDGMLRLQHHQCLQPRTCTASNFCRCNPPKVASTVIDGHHVYTLQPMKTWRTVYSAILHSQADSLRSRVILHEWSFFL